jgi:gliding motility-associated-like protein
MLKFRQFIVFIVFSVFLNLTVFSVALTDPIITCLEVQLNGKVLIKFKEPIDKTWGIDRYVIYFSLTSPIPNSGTGDTLKTLQKKVPGLASASLFYLDTAITNDARTGPIYYRIDAINSNKTIVHSSECISTIYLSVSQPANKIESNWNPPSPTIFNSTASGYKYQLFRSISNVKSDSFQTKNTTYQDFKPNCTDNNYSYTVKLKTIYACSFVSNKYGITVTGVIPDKVLVDSASFDDNNNLIITWPNTKTTDSIVGNYIFLDDNTGAGGSRPLDSIKPPKLPHVFVIPYSKWAGFNTFPEKKRFFLALSNRNCDGGLSATSLPEIKFSPIFLDTAKDNCNNSYNVIISGGSELERGVAYYKVFLKTENNEFKYLDSIPAIPGKNNQYPYKLDSLEEGKRYVFFVRAYNEYGNASASSMRYKFSPTFDNTAAPKEFHLKSISTSSRDVQNIAHFIYKGASTKVFKRFELVRFNCTSTEANKKDRQETVVATIPFVSPLIEDYFIKDLTAKVFTQSYCYYVRAINSCELNAGETDVHKTMLLDIKEGKDVYHQKLYWNNYEGFDKGVSEYKIYRVIDLKPTKDVYKIVTPSSLRDLNVYEDDLHDLTTRDVRVLYFIEAIENSGNVFGSDSAMSNIDTANSNSDFFVPSAFSPNGNTENQVFKPSRFYIDLQNYKFEIYNRFGQIVWSTTDPNKGWDGKEAQSDVYVYKIYFVDAEGRNRTRYGDFILIK